MDAIGNNPLLTDLYQLAMVDAYLANAMTETAVFDFVIRKLPERRGFLLAAGLEQVIDYITGLRFDAESLGWLARSGRVSQRLLDYLADFRFSGDFDAVPEGSVVFADEPIIRVTAPLPAAQLIESRLINLFHLETLIASKAARVRLAAPGKTLVDFGLRRAHGAEAGLLAARASYIAGFSGTATVLAGEKFGIPIFGTMAHSFIQAHDDEMQAFERFAVARPDGLVLLIDTYDTERAATKVVALAKRLAKRGITVQAVRLDSGDLAEHARKVRAILNAGGLQDIGIFASGGLDEEDLLAFSRERVPIAGYGVGTSVDTSFDVPALDCAYKLQEYRGLARRKRAEGKANWPGRKQVWRWYGEDNSFARDVVGLVDERYAGAALLVPVMRAGERCSPAPKLEDIRTHAAAELARLPEPLRRLEPFSYPVELSPALRALAADCDRRSESSEALIDR